MPGSVTVVTGTSSQHVDIDSASLRMLEVVPSSRGSSAASLLGLFKTRTAGGAQLLRASLLQPPAVETTINGRLDALDEILAPQNETLFQALSQLLCTCPSGLNHVVSSFAVAKKRTDGQEAQQVSASIAALLDLRAALALASQLANELAGTTSPLLRSLHAVSTHTSLAQLDGAVNMLLEDEPVVGRNKFAKTTNNVFALRTGTCGLLDVSRRKYCEATESLHTKATSYNEQCAQAGHSMVFRATFANKRGFYLVASTAEFDAAPMEIKALFNQVQRKGKQVHLASIELAALNMRLLDAATDCVMLSQNALDACAAMVREQLSTVTALVEGVALLDVLCAYASLVSSSERTFVRPVFTRDGPIAVQGGRHPILDATGRDTCVPNNVFLSSPASYVYVVGPNASGKSTYIKQAGLLAVLAHAGCYVPADFATFRVLDRICCVGMQECDSAADNSSTFMTECRELQHALACATCDSLVLIDELGRATSTVDAFALGLAVCEHLAPKNTLTLCATHNERLIEAATLVPGVKCGHLRVAACAQPGGGAEWKCGHQLMDGRAMHSCHYGVLIAQHLGMPPTLIGKAHAMVHVLERLAAAETVNIEGLSSVRTLFALAERLAKLNTSESMTLAEMQHALRLVYEVAVECALDGGACHRIGP